VSLVVVGTDTEVGKTVVSALILARYGRHAPLAYWKPIASGATEGRDSDRIRRWVGHVAPVHDELYLFDAPVSPHLAARRERRLVDPDEVRKALGELRRAHPDQRLVVEGIGGVMVPLTDQGSLLIDLLARLRLPCVVVARSSVGTINHTLLTLEALRIRRISVVGVVLNGPGNTENRKAIEWFGDVFVVSEVTPIRPLTRAGFSEAAETFDQREVLREYLT
jgi:dethiobiotin synthetase